MMSKIRNDAAVGASAGVSMRARRGGFILITSLLILVVLTGLGAGALFLTTMNLRIAENTRSSAIAQYNAYEGVDMALLALAREYRNREDGTWPSLSELRGRMPPDSAGRYNIVSLEFDAAAAGEDNPRAGVVTVEGTGPRNSSHMSSARFQGQVTPFDVVGEIDPIFGTGWVTDGSIQIKGGSTFYIPLWAGDDLWTSNTSVIDQGGNFAWAGGTGRNACKIQTGTGLVVCDSPRPRPTIPRFEFDAGLLELASERSATPVEEFDPNGAYCDVTLSGTTNVDASLYTNQTICLEDGANVTITGTATGLYVLGSRSASVNIQANSSPSDSIADCDAALEDGDSRNPNCVGLKVAVGTVSFTGASLTGVNTIYAANSLTDPELGSALAGSDADIVTNVIATERDIEFRGGDGTDLAAVLWANGSVCKIGFGGMNFSGTILARGESNDMGAPCIRGIYWNGAGGAEFSAVSNPNLPEDEDGDPDQVFLSAGIRVLVKRP